MKLIACSMLFLLPVLGFSQDPFPKKPHPELTPGSLCERPSTKRYAEGIPYCSRSVDSSTKREVMETYDRKLGYQVTEMPRTAFKIDHLIPLCMGGSNNPDNLWPQHQTVYAVTDPLEQKTCQDLAQGKIRQKEAIQLILRAKHSVR